MPGWRERRRRAEQATIPTDAVQERGKRAEAAILSLKEKFPNWGELGTSHPVSSMLREHERVCAEMIEILVQRDIEPLFGSGQPKAALMEPEASAAAKAEAAAESEMPKSWQEIEIAFLSDERVEICRGDRNRETRNYGELGFADRRNGKPNRAWEMLREMASSGTIPRPLPGKDKAKTQKRIEEIREKLRGHFEISADPIPFNGNAYQASFKISRRPSVET